MFALSRPRACGPRGPAAPLFVKMNLLLRLRDASTTMHATMVAWAKRPSVHACAPARPCPGPGTRPVVPVAEWIWKDLSQGCDKAQRRDAPPPPSATQATSYIMNEISSDNHTV